MLTPAFHFNILQKFLPIFIQESNGFVGILKKQVREDTEIVTLVSKFTLNTICGEYSIIKKKNG